MGYAVLARVTLPSLTGATKDQSVNDWAFHTAEAGVAIADDQAALSTALATFYSALHARFGASRDSTTNACRVDLYDIGAELGGAPHGSPVYTKAFTLGATATDQLPEQCAMVFGFHADYGTAVEFLGGTGEGHRGGTRPRARLRGRLYFGPLGLTNCVSYDSTFHRMRIDPVAFIPAFQTALNTLRASALTGSTVGARWAIWSRKDAAVRTVTSSFIDDSVRTQRRRVEPFNTRHNLAMP